MELVRWNPGHDMLGWRKRINRIFNDAFIPMSAGNEGFSLSNWEPVVDVYDTDDKVVVKAEMPGVDKKNIEILVKDGILTLTGERSVDKEINEKNVHFMERSHGRFLRSFSLPGEVDPETIKAEYKNGVLKVEIPKPQKSQPKRVSIN